MHGKTDEAGVEIRILSELSWAECVSGEEKKKKEKKADPLLRVYELPELAVVLPR